MHTEKTNKEQPFSIQSWYKQWLEAIRGSIEETTFAQYQHCLTRYIFPYYGDVPLDSLNEDSVQAFYNSLGRNGKNLSAQTVHLIKTVLHQGLDYAVNNCVLAYNPSDLAYTAKRYYNRSEILSSKIIRHILHKDFHNTYENMFPVLLLTTMRYGECAGLSWDAIDDKRKTLAVKQQLVEYQKNGHTVQSLKPYPKGQRRREILLPDLVFQYLLDQKTLQQKFQTLSGAGWNNLSNLVFTNPDGSALRHYKVNRRFKKLVNFYGMPEATIHTLRHTGCSILYNVTGDVSVVREYSGHSSDGAAVYYIHSLASIKGDLQP